MTESRHSTPRQELPPTGVAIDRSGGPVVDPTLNVIALVKSEAQRLDESREALASRFTIEIGHLKDVAHLRAEHARELATRERERLDATRQFDVQAVTVATGKADAAIAALAATTAAMAETLRTSQDARAKALSDTLATTVAGFNDHFGKIDARLAEIQGKGAGLSSGWAILLSAVGLIATLMAVGTAVYSLNRTPQVVYAQPAIR